MGSHRKTCLLNPGPVTLTSRVRQALQRPDLCHREAEYSRLQTDVRVRLTQVYKDTAEDYSAVLFTGSGTAAVEAMVGSLVPRDGKALVAANGVYGERIAAMLKMHGKNHHVVAAEWTSPIDFEGVENSLLADNTFTHVIAVHHETTTGRLNDIARLGEICRRYGVALLLDTVSSFGGEALEFKRWNIEACAATANKCLHGVPGISFVIVKKEALETRTTGACSIYLDLYANYEAQNKGVPLFTPAVQCLYALQEALSELDDSGGWKFRNREYRQLAQFVRLEFNVMGIDTLLPDQKDFSSTLTAFNIPEGFAFDEIHAPLKEAGFIIYPGQYFLKYKIFRIAVMGDLQIDDMQRFLDVFKRLLFPAQSVPDYPQWYPQNGTLFQNNTAG